MRNKIIAFIKIHQRTGRLTRHQAVSLITEFDKQSVNTDEHGAYELTLHKMNAFIRATFA